MNRDIEQQDIDKEPGAVIEFEASITACRLKHAVSVLEWTDDEVIFKISKDMISSRVLDPGNSVLTQVNISMTEGDYCTALESYRVGIDLKKMESILKRADAKDRIHIEAGIDGAWRVWRFKRDLYPDWSIFKRGIHQRSLPLLDPKELRCPPRLKPPHIATVLLSGKEFKEILDEAEDVSTIIEFRASADGVTFSTKDERRPAEKYICALSAKKVELLPGSKARGQYRLDNLEEFAVNIIPKDEITVQFANDTPCEIRYERDGVSVQHILAPRRIESR